ncbi:unnamed protein product, partial [Amoebophrya sp. A120]|eukprot:GSA120T00021542001.1
MSSWKIARRRLASSLFFLSLVHNEQTQSAAAQYTHPAETRRSLTAEEVLKANLFKGYQADSRPIDQLALNDIRTSSGNFTLPSVPATNVRIQIYVQALENLDQLDGTIRIAIWLRQKWTDHRLVYPQFLNVTTVMGTPDLIASGDPNSFKIVNEEDATVLQSLGYTLVTRQVETPAMISVPTDPIQGRSVWVPDLLLYNTAEKPFDNLVQSQASLYRSGLVIWSRPGMTKALCNFKLADFPYDTQTCEYKMGSWGYDAGALKLLPYDTSAPNDDFTSGVDINAQEVMVNSEWKIARTKGYLVSKLWNCCPFPYETFHFSLEAERQSKVYTATFVVPGVILLLMMLLLAPFIPWQSGERVGYMVTLMLALVVFLLMAEEHLPKGEESTWLSNYLMVLFYIAVAILVFIIALTRFEVWRHDKAEEQEKHHQTELLEQQTKLLKESNSRGNLGAASGKAQGFMSRGASLWGRTMSKLKQQASSKTTPEG